MHWWSWMTWTLIQPARCAQLVLTCMWKAPPTACCLRCLPLYDVSSPSTDRRHQDQHWWRVALVIACRLASLPSFESVEDGRIFSALLEPVTVSVFYSQGITESTKPTKQLNYLCHDTYKLIIYRVSLSTLVVLQFLIVCYCSHLVLGLFSLA